MATQIMHWNARGLLHNLDDITELLHKHNPKVLCIQETHLKPSQTNFLRQYAVFRKDRDEATASSGGVAIIVQKSVPCRPLILQTALEAVSVRVILFDKLVTVCSLYIPPSYKLNRTDFHHLIDQLPAPYIVVGDLNAHNTLWGDARCDARGRLIEQFLLCSGACLFNKKQPTYYNIHHNSYSSIDLALGSPSLFTELEWNVVMNSYGSDHFPAMLNLTLSHEVPPHIPKWKIASADWEKFQELTLLPRDFITNCDIDCAVAFFSAFILDAAEKCIPQTNGHSCKRRVPWWNDDCREARRKQNKAWGILRRYPNAENLVEFKKVKSLGRRTRRQARRESWVKFLSGINSYTNEKKVWSSLRSLKGQQAYPLPLVSQGNTLEDQANSLGKHFERISSSAHYSKSFLKHKEMTERKTLELKSKTNEQYNTPFKIAELRTALNACHSTAPGPDRIMYDMLKHLHDDTEISLLALYNTIWAAGYLPSTWREAIVVPILKEGKDPSSVTSYRPIALTSCLCKVFEKMINKRLMHFLETNKLLDPFQCGFREDRSTTDHLIRIEAYIRDAFIHKQYCLCVFLDMEKAYDTTWRYGILRDLSDIGIHGNMLNIIKSYLSERTFRVRIGNVLSRPFIQETGVPQGGVLSCTLFIIKMNSLRLCIPHNTFYSMYVDDIQVGFRSCNLAVCERHVQLCLNKVSKWADQNGFRLSPEKSTCVLFSRKRGLHPNPEIDLLGQRLPVEAEHKFLGLILDSKLTFTSHIKYIKNKCIKTMNILKVLSRTSWGSDRNCLINLYKSLVRTRLDYGAIIYQSATPSALKMLDPVHHLGIRLSTGAFRTSPVESLYVESNEWSLHLQRTYMSFIYYLKTNADKEHPSHTTINDLSSCTLFENRPSFQQPYSLRVRSLAEQTGVPLIEHSLMAPVPCLPPWQWQPIDCDTSFVEVTKHAPIAHIHTHFLELQHKYNCPEFFTDASKSDSGVSYAAVGPSFSDSGILHPNSSIFTAEAYAILVAAKHIKELKLQRAIIFTDSLSVIKALKTLKKHKNPVFLMLYSLLCTIYSLKKQVVLCWVPGHREIRGNVLADQLAASAKDNANTNASMAVSALELKQFVKQKLRAHWQLSWDKQTRNKLHVIKPSLGTWPSISRSRHTQVILTRLQIGHTHSTHSHLLSGGDPPVCDRCGDPLSVLHILIECKELDALRQKHFLLLHRHQMPLHPSMFIGKEPVFKHKSLLAFLKDINNFHVIFPGNP